MSKRVVCLSLVTVAALWLAGCGDGGKAAGGKPVAGGAAAGKKLRLAFVPNNASDFWTIARAGCEKAVAELGTVDLAFMTPPDGTAAQQKQILEDLLVKGVDGIAISPVDPSHQTEVLNDVAKQVLLITQDSDAPKSNRACYVGTDNVAAGKQAGELIKEALPDGGKIMVFVGMLDAQNARDRFDGIQEVLKGSKVEILGCRTDDIDRARAKNNVADTIVKYPDVACLVGLWSYNGPAILGAVRDADKVGKVKIVCFDEENATLQGVKDGAIYATVVQQPYEFGYQAIKLMAKARGGDPGAIPANKLLIVPTLKITKDDVDKFWEKLKKLRGK